MVPAYKDCEPQIKRFAARVLRRLNAAAARAITLDDVVQELAIAYCVARDKWRADGGASFATFLHFGMQVHINRWAQAEIDQSHAAPMSLDFEQEGEEDVGGIHELVADEAPLADDITSESQLRNMVLESLSAPARKFLELLDSPPPEIFQELDALAAQRRYARERGITCFSFKNVSSGLIFDLMGICRQDRGAILREIRAVTERVSQL